jgi:hypothetical protein
MIAEHAGHVLVHRIQEPDAHARAVLLASTGHGYLGYLQGVVGLCAVLVGAGLVGRVVAGFRNRPLRSLPSLWWAGLPAIAFLLQELSGELAHTGAVQWSPLVEPVLVLGVALESVCGVACVLVVRKLLVAAHTVGRALASAVEIRSPLATLSLERCWPQLDRQRLTALARGAGERAPPTFA